MECAYYLASLNGIALKCDSRPRKLVPPTPAFFSAKNLIRSKSRLQFYNEPRYGLDRNGTGLLANIVLPLSLLQSRVALHPEPLFWFKSLSQKRAYPLEASRFFNPFARLAGEGQTPFGVGSKPFSVPTPLSTSTRVEKRRSC